MACFSMKGSLIKRYLIRFTDRPLPKNARLLLVWVYRERCDHTLYAFWASYTLCLCWFCAAKASLRSSSAITPFCVLISQNVAHASDSNDYACVMRTWLWFATEQKKNQAGISTWASPLESPSNKVQCVPRLKHYNFQYLELHTETFFLTSFWKNSVRMCLNMYLAETVHQMT